MKNRDEIFVMGIITGVAIMLFAQFTIFKTHSVQRPVVQVKK